uniref:Uncharacterized protein n=1 Tax=Leersia perrieri TaxID=77586 RepID=A0A0D9W318_9ORYZ
MPTHSLHSTLLPPPRVLSHSLRPAHRSPCRCRQSTPPSFSTSAAARVRTSPPFTSAPLSSPFVVPRSWTVQSSSVGTKPPSLPPPWSGEEIRTSIVGSLSPSLGLKKKAVKCWDKLEKG